MKKLETQSIDWLKVTIHFICGAILGAIIGAGIWAYWTDRSLQSGILFAGLGALVMGIAAGLFLDSFWEWLKDHGHWLWP